MTEETLKNSLSQIFSPNPNRKLKVYTNYYGALMFQVYFKNFRMVNRLLKIKTKIK